MESYDLTIAATGSTTSAAIRTILQTARFASASLVHREMATMTRDWNVCLSKGCASRRLLDDLQDLLMIIKSRWQELSLSLI